MAPISLLAVVEVHRVLAAFVRRRSSYTQPVSKAIRAQGYADQNGRKPRRLVSKPVRYVNTASPVHAVLPYVGFRPLLLSHFVVRVVAVNHNREA